MNEKSESGSAGLRKNSNIELMINRRMIGWDYYGMPERLDDINSK